MWRTSPGARPSGCDPRPAAPRADRRVFVERRHGVQLADPGTSTTRRTCSGVARAETTRPGSGAGVGDVSAERRSATAPRPGRSRAAAAPVDNPGVAEEERGLRRRPGRAHTSATGPCWTIRPVAHHRDPVGDRERLLLVVGDQQRGGARPRAGWSAGLRPAARAARRRGPTAARRAAAAGARRPATGPARPAAVRRRRGCRAAGRRTPRGPTSASSSATRLGDVRGAAEPQRVADVARHGQVGEELAVLEHQGEAALVGRDAGQVAGRPRGPVRTSAARARRPRAAASTCRSPTGRARPAPAPSGTVDGWPRDGRHAVVGDREIADLEHQNAPSDGTPSRSTASITSAVVAARTTEAASAMP